MSFDKNKIEIQQEQQTDEGEKIQQFIYRLLPFWPLIAIAIITGFLFARVYLRYQTTWYSSKTRVVVNDNTDSKTANLTEIVKLDTRDLSAETEREIQVLTSKELINKVVDSLQLNVSFSQKGRFKTSYFYKNTLFRLELEHPSMVTSSFLAEAELLGNKVRYNGDIYPLNTWIPTTIGNIRWTINNDFKGPKSKGKKYFIYVETIAAATNRIKGLIAATPITKGSSIIDITCSDYLTDRAVEILGTLTTIYGRTSLEFKSLMFLNAQNFLDERLRIVSDELGGIEKNLQNYKVQSGIIDISREGEIYLTRIKDIDSRISEMDVQIDVLKQIEDYVTRRNKSAAQVPASLGSNDGVLNSLLNQMYQSEFEL